MSKAQNLNIGDVRSVFYLLNDLRDLGSQPQLWKRFMLEQLCRLINGQVGISVETQNAGAVDLRSSTITDVGWASEKERRVWVDYCRQNNLSVDPSREALMRLMATAHPFTRIRQQLCPDRQWYSDAHVQITRKESDVDSFIFSYRRLINPPRHHWLYLLRTWNDRPFEARQRRLVRLFHSELGRILEQDAATNGKPAIINHLSPRLCQTLDLLACGLSEKQVATRLACSNHTVHGYVKELHKRLAVRTRSELLLKISRQNQLAQRRLIL